MPPQQLLRGAALMILSAAIYSVSDISVKVFQDDLSVWQISLGRFLFGFLLLPPMIRAAKTEKLLHPGQTGLLLLRGFFGCVTFLFYVAGLMLLPISVAMPLFYIYPAFGAVFARFILKEQVAASDVVAIMVAVLGVWFLSRTGGGGGPVSAAGVVLVLISAMSAGMGSTLSRKLVATHSPQIIYFYFCLVGLLVTLPLLAFFNPGPVIPGGRGLAGLFLLIAPAMLVGQLIMNYGYKYISTAKGSVLQSVEVVFAALYGVLALHEPFTAWSLVGITLIMLSAALLAIKPK